MTVPATDPAHPAQRSVAGRFFGYPLVTVLVGFVLIVFVLQAIVFGNLIRLFMLLTGAPLPPPEQRGLPQDPAALSAYGYGTLAAALITVPIAFWIYRRVIVRWCEGRADVGELAWGPATRRWVIVGAASAAVVLAVAVLAVALAGGRIEASAAGLLLPGLAYAVGISLFAGVAEELFARGVLFRISEQHTGSVIALVITAMVFGVQHADNPNATVLSTLAVAIEGGLMLAAVYMLTRTLWAVMAVHFVWNFGQSVLGLPVSGNQSPGAVRLTLSGPDVLTGGTFGIEVSMVSLVLWTTVTVVVLVLAARHGRWWSWASARRAVRAGAASTPVGIPLTGAGAGRG